MGVAPCGHAAGALLVGEPGRLALPGLHPALRAGGPLPGVRVHLRGQPAPDAGQPEEEAGPGCGQGEGGVDAAPPPEDQSWAQEEAEQTFSGLAGFHGSRCCRLFGRRSQEKVLIVHPTSNVFFFYCNRGLYICYIL